MPSRFNVRPGSSYGIRGLSQAQTDKETEASMATFRDFIKKREVLEAKVKEAEGAKQKASLEAMQQYISQQSQASLTYSLGMQQAQSNFNNGSLSSLIGSGGNFPSPYGGNASDLGQYLPSPMPPILPPFGFPIQPADNLTDTAAVLGKVLGALDKVLARIDDLEATIEFLQEQVEEMHSEK